MLKNISKLGIELSKTKQQLISGGSSSRCYYCHCLTGEIVIACGPDRVEACGEAC
ncbi:hypothetical protein [Tenacibaculum amylolyticum]|uniref:hypothetical protein n=1 Tax=Tenacibaculum amylolyticum TaxID=104269 RepID=UPI0038B4B725